ncbi:MAG: alpha/beta fold hydrolase [Proteobacteria bacterium]|nr:alpha/beta fold hydrolase [Pseudomonadota bacterium]
MILAGIEAGEAGARPPLVLLHGLFGAARNFGAIVRAMGAQRRVVALDLRNHGDSPHAAGMDYDTMADDVLESLAARGALPCALVGHSMGGKVAMRAALRRPEAVARLLVSDIAPVAYAPASIAYARAMAALPLKPGLTRAAADAALAATVAEAPLRAFLLQNLAFGPPPRWRIGLDHILAGFGDIGDWPALPPGASYAGPALFVAGARSDYILPEYRPAIRALFPASRFVTVKDAGHWVHADNPAGFMAVLQAFLAAA